MTHERKVDLLVGLATRLVRIWIATLRLHVTDRDGALTRPAAGLIWAFWHNRLFIMPYVFERWFPGHTAAGLTSASKDGEYVAAFIRRFRGHPIRGSSSRRGAAALVELRRALRSGEVAVLTPDGPRGPRYQHNPGVIKLAQLAGAPVQPIHVRYSRCWRVPSWDGFMIPWPFSRVEIIFEPLHHVAPTAGDAEFEEQRRIFEQALRMPNDE